MDKKPIAFSGSHWRVTLEDSPISVTDNYHFNYQQGLLTTHFPIDIKLGNPARLCLSGKPNRRDYIDILYMVSDHDDSRFLSNTGDTIRFVMRCVTGSQSRDEIIYDHVLTSDFVEFIANFKTYGYHMINKRIYLSTIPNYESVDLFLLGVNVKQGGAGNEYSVEVRHTKFL